MKIVVSGGGTAGHISPALAVAGALKQLDSTSDILYVGQSGGMEASMAAAADLSFAGISAGKYRRVAGGGFDASTALLNLRDVFLIILGIMQSLWLLSRFRPAVVFGKGGFVALPVVIAARILGIPSVIHESDVSPGLGTRLLQRWATKVAVGFPVENYSLDQNKLVFVGNPIRSEHLNSDKPTARKRFGLVASKPVLLVMGGSQGAHAINEAVVGQASALLDMVQIIHITGQQEYEWVNDRARDLLNSHYKVLPFLVGEEMGMAYCLADLAVSRAGANAIAELAAWKLASIIVPNQAAAAHQLDNARALEQAGAAKVLLEPDLDRLSDSVQGLLDKGNNRKELGKHLSAFYIEDAPTKLASIIIEAARSKGAA